MIYLGIVRQQLLLETRRGRIQVALPLVVAVSGYSGWMSSLLVPSLRAPDLLAGCWEALGRLGGLPRHLVLDANGPAAECEGFFRSLGVDVVVSDDEELRFINATHRYLAEEFFIGRSGRSFDEFNSKLAAWLQVDNAVPANRPQGHRAVVGVERVVLSMADRQALRELPPRPDACTWRFNFQVQDLPFARFGGNDYEVHPALIGQRVLVTADLSRVQVIFAGSVVVSYKRAWGRGHVVPWTTAVQPRISRV